MWAEVLRYELVTDQLTAHRNSAPPHCGTAGVTRELWETTQHPLYMKIHHDDYRIDTGNQGTDVLRLTVQAEPELPIHCMARSQRPAKGTCPEAPKSSARSGTDSKLM